LARNGGEDTNPSDLRFGLGLKVDGEMDASVNWDTEVGGATFDI
jgi:hypothetical protein